MAGAAKPFDIEPLTAERVGAIMQRLGLCSDRDHCISEALSGGVSSDIWKVTVDERSYCLKRALPRLRVAQLWEAPIERNAWEWAWLQTAGMISPGAVPPLVAEDRDAGLFVMGYLDPGDHPSWKSLLMRGVARLEDARAIAERLVAIHAATAGHPAIAEQFRTDANFYAIRLEPYLVAAAHVHPELAAPLQAIVRDTAGTRLALVHGDVSPKNILLGPNGPVFLDAECAWYGDPSFDLAFCLNHLLLKCLWCPSAAQSYLACFDVFASTYFAGASWEPRAALEARAARLLPGLLLARVDGKSPVEYITDDQAKDRVRHIASALLLRPAARLDEVREAWSEEIR